MLDISHFQSTVSAAVNESAKYVNRMGEHCGPKYFYRTYRFFLNGWGTNDILPDGIEFEARFLCLEWYSLYLTVNVGKPKSVTVSNRLGNCVTIRSLSLYERKVDWKFRKVS